MRFWRRCVNVLSVFLSRGLDLLVRVTTGLAVSKTRSCSLKWSRVRG